MKSNNILVTLFATVSIATRGLEACSFKRLNDYLVANVRNDDPDSNMEAALIWLQKQEGVKRSFFSRAPIDDLMKFTALKQVMDDDKCDHAAHEIMRTNEEAVSLHKKVHDRKYRRVDKVMLDIFHDHAMRCSSVYPDRYTALRKQVDGEVYRRVEYLSELVVDAHRETLTFPDDRAHFEPDFYFYQYVLVHPSIRSFRRANILLEALKHLAESDPNIKYLRKVRDERKGREIIDKDKIKELVRKHLIEPCQQYEAVMEPDLFGPASFDLDVYYLLNEDNKDYYVDWSYYMICRALTRDEQAVSADVIKSVAES